MSQPERTAAHDADVAANANNKQWFEYYTDLRNKDRAYAEWFMEGGTHKRYEVCAVCSWGPPLRTSADDPSAESRSATPHSQLPRLKSVISEGLLRAVQTKLSKTRAVPRPRRDFAELE